MNKRLKYFAIYAGGYTLFVIAMGYAFDIGIMGNIRNTFWLALAYFIANMAGDIERIARYEDMT